MSVEHQGSSSTLYSPIVNHYIYPTTSSIYSSPFTFIYILFCSLSTNLCLSIYNYYYLHHCLKNLACSVGSVPSFTTKSIMFHSSSTSMYLLHSNIIFCKHLFKDLHMFYSFSFFRLNSFSRLFVNTIMNSFSFWWNIKSIYVYLSFIG